MFTGLVQQAGRVLALETEDPGGRLVIDAAPWDRPFEHGESISVSGVCLSLAGTQQGEHGEGIALRFDVLNETFDKTTLGDLAVGEPVNLERALRYGDPLGGHIVTGHVDGRGTVAEVEPVGRDWRVAVHCDDDLLAGMVRKGSICVDGVSLTIAELRDNGFAVHLIPITWEVTSLHRLQPGRAVNLEIDVLAKLVQRRLERGESIGELTWDDFRVSD